MPYVDRVDSSQPAKMTCRTLSSSSRGLRGVCIAGTQEVIRCLARTCGLRGEGTGVRDGLYGGGDEGGWGRANANGELNFCPWLPLGTLSCTCRGAVVVGAARATTVFGPWGFEFGCREYVFLSHFSLNLETGMVEVDDKVPKVFGDDRCGEE